MKFKLNLMRYHFFVLWMVSFLMGIFLKQILFINQIAVFLISLVLFLYLVMRFFQKNWFKALIITFLALVFGSWKLYLSQTFDKNHVSFLEEGKYVFEGCIRDEVDVRSENARYTLDLKNVEFAGVKNMVSGKILVVAEKYPEYFFGDCLRIYGNFKKPFKIEDFDYGGYLSRFDIYGLLYYPRIEFLSPDGSGNVFYEKLFSLKVKIESEVSQIFPEPYASFMAGLILGSRRGIPQELMMDFNLTGLSHIIAVSGYNINLLIAFIAGIFSFLSKGKRVFFSILFIWMFVILVGASSAVVRAGLMGVIGLLALNFGNLYYVKYALIFVAALMNFLNPKILLFDVGFQLSFLATAGLIFFSDLIKEKLKFLPEKFGFRESVVMTVSAQVLALPIMLLNFDQLSLISLLANFLTAPLIPLAMMSGMIAVLFSFFSNFLGLFLGVIPFVSLKLLVLIIQFLAKVPFVALDMSFFTVFMAIFYYYFALRMIIFDKKEDDCVN